MRAAGIVGLTACVLASCGARSGLEVDPPEDAGRPDALIFDTFTCRWSWVSPPWTLMPVAPGVVRAAIHTTADVGAFTSESQFVGFDLTPPPGAAAHGVVRVGVPEEPLLAWPHGPGWHLLGGVSAGRCRAEARSDDLRTMWDARDFPGRARCAFDPIGAEAARITWGTEVEVFAIGDSLEERRIAHLSSDSSLAPRVARERDGTVWVATIVRGDVTLHAVRDTAVVATESLGGALVAPPLAPDRLRGGVIAAMWDGSTLRLVRVSMGAASLEQLELGALPADSRPPVEIVTTEAEILFARADGSYTSVPLSGAAARSIPAPEPGAGPGALAMRDGTSFGYAVYPADTSDVSETRIRPLDCNR
jgi:hypothetical protein